MIAVQLSAAMMADAYRDGEVHASWERDGDALLVRIGGEAVIVASGQLFL